MKKRLVQLLIAVAALLFVANQAVAHCEIPCGIYDDQARIDQLLEHATTIEKSMNQINDLQKDAQHANQTVRWVMNKEDHANQLQEIVSQYFMTQRIKFDAKDYDKKLGQLHQMLIYTMKCKQTTDLENVEKLRTAIKAFQALYFAGK